MTRGPAIWPDDRRLDAEVRERLDERVRGALVGAADALRDGGRGRQHRAVGQHVGPLGARRVEERRLLVGLPFRVEQQRRRLRESFGDDVRIVVDDVDGRLVRGREETMVLLAGSNVRTIGALERAAGGAVRAPHHVTGSAQEGAVRGAREQEATGEKRRQADEEGARAAQERLEPAAEQVADEPALAGAERRHQAQERHAEPDAERREADERAAEEHQPADGDERRRGRVRGAAQEVAKPLLDLLADDARRRSRGRAARRGRGRARRARARSARGADAPLGCATSSSAS